MNKKLLWAGALSLALSAGSVLAADLKIQGKSASGKPGELVFVEAIYDFTDFSAGFGVIAEDFQFEYQSDGITFNPTASMIGAAGAVQPLLAYVSALTTFAQGHQGSVLVNPNISDILKPDLKGYALSFQVADSAHLRGGMIHLNLAFDISLTALPGARMVSFTDKNVLADVDGNEFSYPTALQQLSVTVVPEPQIAWLLLPGLALVGVYARRRTGRSL